jgi:dephospho-CoA kinase
MGSGKSTVAQILASQGAFVLDADAVGHALIDQRPSRIRVVERFGPEVLVPPSRDETEPHINRKALGAIVFEDRHARHDLEAILHPRMRRTFEKSIARLERKRTYRLIVLDAAILFEAGWNDLCDRVVFVDAPRQNRLERLMAQRQWTAADLASRELHQIDLETKGRLADYVLTNEGPVESLGPRISEMLKILFARPNNSNRGTTHQGKTDTVDAHS